MERDPNIVLQGGPASLPDAERMRHLSDTHEKLKLRHLNRYEHFEPTSHMRVHQGRDLKVFEWTGTTYVAE
jgi:hypothetical protein